MSPTTKHWTEKNVDAFVHRIATDFASQLENRMETETVTHTELADSLNITVGRVSQILNNPGNLTLRNMVRCSRSLGMKVAIVAYDDGDAENRNGPINSDIFNQCWQKCGKPTDFFSLSESTSLHRGYMILGFTCYPTTLSMMSLANKTEAGDTAITGQNVVAGGNFTHHTGSSMGTLISTRNETTTTANAHVQSTADLQFAEGSF